MKTLRSMKGQEQSNLMLSIESELNYIRMIQEALMRARTAEFGKLLNFPAHLCVFSDWAAHYSHNQRAYGPAAILYYAIDLLLHEWNSVTLDLLSGCHNSAARTLRWIWETALGAAIATVDGSVLYGSKSSKPLSLTGFQNWLRNKEKDPRTYNLSRKVRKRAMLKLHASTTQVALEENLYSELCRYSHLSQTSFIKHVKNKWFNISLTTNPLLFDQVFRLALRTIDFTLFSFIQAYANISKMNKEYPAFVDSYAYHNFGFNMPPRLRKVLVTLRPNDVPVAWQLIKTVVKQDSTSLLVKAGVF